MRTLLGFAVAVAGIAAAAAEPSSLPRLEDFVSEAGTAFATDQSGGLAVWSADRRTILTWDGDGDPRSRCVAEDPRLPNSPGTIAYNDGKALLFYSDFEAGSETLRKTVLIDTDRCEVLGTGAVPGVVHGVQAVSDGWIAFTREPFAPNSNVLELGADGTIADAFALDTTFDKAEEEGRVEDSPLARTAQPLVVGRDLWLLPQAAYELWFPPQRGRSSRTVTPPPCLAADARVLRGADSAAFLQERAKHFPADLRAPLVAAAAAGNPGPIVFSPTAGAIVADRLLAVKVFDDRLVEGARLDVWDLTTESVVAVVPFPTDRRLLASANGTLWVLDDGRRIQRQALPEAGPPTFDPCAALPSPQIAADMEGGATAIK